MELNRIMDFSEFINEASSVKPHVVMLIGGGTNEFSRSFEKECKRKGIRVNVLDIDSTEVEIGEKGHNPKTKAREVPPSEFLETWCETRW